MGQFTLELYPDQCPKTVANFIEYVESGFYEGLIFHRVINNFMIQGGGMTEDMQQKTTRAPIENEAAQGIDNEIGTIAMARTMDPHSASSQFFINVSNNRFLNNKEAQDGWGYTAFGRVIAGMDTVNAIKAVATGHRAGHQDGPLEPVVIRTMAVVAD
jgi:peptidyl-prolyl cis-trans isomerase B (cyclophilin B)